MKKLILLFAFIGLISCKSDDDLKPGDISGEWKMTAYFGYLPELPQIEKGSVVWNIDAKNISMTNNSEYIYVSNNGTYNYNWINPTTIRVYYSQQFMGYYKVNLSNNKLLLTETHGPGESEFSDPSTLEFEK